MKIADMRALDDKKINAEILKAKKEQLNLRFQNAAGQLENTSLMRKTRRAIAQLKTIKKQSVRGMKDAKTQKTTAQKTIAQDATEQEAKTQKTTTQKTKTQKTVEQKTAEKK